MVKPPISTVAIVPSARRLVTSLRDLGYDLLHAVADIVDNSLAAGATDVRIDLHFAGPESWLRIADNGTGMSAIEINEAMRFGADRAYAQNDLGKFGLGLKTASLSQCRRLVVASRSAASGSAVEVRCLDLDHIEQTDRWEVLMLDPDTTSDVLVTPLSRRAGTVVLWQCLDRMMAYKSPKGGHARAGLESLAQQLNDHLGMVFHRFLAGEVTRRARLSIRVNEAHVVPWDPFAVDEASTETLPGAEISVATGTSVGLVRFRPFVLPSEKLFSSGEAFRRLAGPRRWNAQQGFYIYRANRMIQSGGWCRMRAPDEHAKLARASIDFFPELDAAFEVNVAKARVGLPQQLREGLTPHIESWVRRAQAVYRAGAKSSADRAAPSEPSMRDDRKLAGLGMTLERAARQVGESKALRRIVAELIHSDPHVAAALGWHRSGRDPRRPRSAERRHASTSP